MPCTPTRLCLPTLFERLLLPKGLLVCMALVPHGKRGGATEGETEGMEARQTAWLVERLGIRGDRVNVRRCRHQEDAQSPGNVTQEQRREIEKPKRKSRRARGMGKNRVGGVSDVFGNSEVASLRSKSKSGRAGGPGLAAAAGGGFSLISSTSTTASSV